jgi:uncharacterized protein (TIGR00369 family)
VATRDAEPIDDGHCFACGKRSAIGLHLTFATEADDSVRCELVLARPYQGWQGVAHGGIVAMLLDEAMAYAAAAGGRVRGMTASLAVRYRRRVPTGVPLVLTGKLIGRRSTVLSLEARIESESGELLASGTAQFVATGTLAPGEVLGSIGA